MTVTLLGYTLDFLSVIGILAAIVMIVTEMIKDLWVIKKIPTKLTALIISVVVVAGAMVLYLKASHTAFVWWFLCCFYRWVFKHKRMGSPVFYLEEICPRS